MKVLSNNFIKTFGYKIINIHPSLLPKYKGLNTHKRVLKNSEKYSGCTVHFVTNKLDSGKIILQKKVFINKNETENKLSNLLKQHAIIDLENKISKGRVLGRLKTSTTRMFFACDRAGHVGLLL